jgi:hypothetical protein
MRFAITTTFVIGLAKWFNRKELPLVMVSNNVICDYNVRAYGSHLNL